VALDVGRRAEVQAIPVVIGAVFVREAGVDAGTGGRRTILKAHTSADRPRRDAQRYLVFGLHAGIDANREVGAFERRWQAADLDSKGDLSRFDSDLVASAGVELFLTGAVPAHASEPTPAQCAVAHR